MGRSHDGFEGIEVNGKRFRKRDYADIFALPCLNYSSNFINKVFNFLGIGVALYTVALVYGWASSDSVIKHTVKCKFCRKRISEKVSFLSWSRLELRNLVFDDVVLGATLCELYELAGWSGAVSIRDGGMNWARCGLVGYVCVVLVLVS